MTMYSCKNRLEKEKTYSENVSSELAREPSAVGSDTLLGDKMSRPYS